MNILRPVGVLGMHGIALAPEGRGPSFATNAKAVLDQCRVDVQKFALQHVATLQELVEARGAASIAGRNIDEALAGLGKVATLAAPPEVTSEVDAAKTLLLGAQEALKPLMVPKERAPAEEGARVLSATASDGTFDPSIVFGNVRFNGFAFDDAIKKVTPRELRALNIRGLEGVALFLAERNPNDALLTVEAGRLFDLADILAKLPNRALDVFGTLLKGSLRAESIDLAPSLHAPEYAQAVQLANLFLLLHKLMKRRHTTPKIVQLEVCVHGPNLFGKKAHEFLTSPSKDDLMDYVMKIVTHTINPRRLTFSIAQDLLRVRERFEEARAPRLHHPPRRTSR